jgi:hypothetical protein
MKPFSLSRLTKLSLFISSIFLGVSSYGQGFIFGNENVKWEAGLNFGPTTFLGDLGGNPGKGKGFVKDVNLEFTNLMTGAYITAYPKPYLGVRLAANFATLRGADDVIKTLEINALWRKQRNLDFKTKIQELNLNLEILPTMFKQDDPETEPRLKPYVLVGAGIFRFNPQGSLTDLNGNKKWYDLQPLRTEGQGFSEHSDRQPYQLTQFNVLSGGGVKYHISDRVLAGLEVVHRFTYTDYIDDVSKTYVDPALFSKYMPAQKAAIASAISDKTKGIIYPGMTRQTPGLQRGDNGENDAYFSIVFKLGFRLGPIYTSSFSRSAARQTRCPSFY